MKTSEFIKEVEALGFDTGRFFETGVSVRTEYREDVLKIGSQTIYKIDCFHDAYDNLDSCIREKLFKLAVEYASTPLEKRVEEKKYYIKLIGTAGWCDCIAYNEKRNHYFMSPNYEYPGYKTKFTLKQIKEYGLPNFADSDLFELVEVE